MNVVVVFHSVCGNTYLMARAFERSLKSAGHMVTLKRVHDADWLEKPDLPAAVVDLLRQMRSLPEAVPADLVGADMILMGSPVYFGNVTAEMKAFMDSTGAIWYQGKLAGKRFSAFVSAGNAEGGGSLALAAFHTYAHYMGLLTVPCSNRILPGENTNALGIIQYSNGKSQEALDDKTDRLIDAWSRSLQDV